MDAGRNPSTYLQRIGAILFLQTLDHLNYSFHSQKSKLAAEPGILLIDKNYPEKKKNDVFVG